MIIRDIAIQANEQNQELALDDLMLELNAKCRTYNKFGNPELAKGLRREVDERDTIIDISSD